MSNIAPFTFELHKSISKNLVFQDGVVIHPLFFKMKLNKTYKNLLLQLIEMLDPATGLLSQEFSDGRIVPLTERQLSVALGKDLKDSLKELVAYGVLAEIKIARNRIYAVNPFVITKGLHCNGYLFKLFNKTTLTRFDEFNEYFNSANEAEFNKFWNRLEEI